MTTPSPDGPESADLTDKRFTEVFGVSQADLRQRGIDPDAYAEQNIGRALKDKKTQDLLISKSGQFSLEFYRWAQRGWIAIFVGLGCLVISKYAPLHWVGLGAAFLAALAVVAIFVMTYRYWRKYAHARRDEGLSPSWRRPGRSRN